MSNEDIVGGLKSALERGESFQRAMMSFYSAGYKKEDIEWAARSLQMRMHKKPEIIKKPEKILKKNLKAPKEPKRVSDYEKPLVPEGKISIIALSILLFIVLSILVSLLFFKEEIITFFNNLF